MEYAIYSDIEALLCITCVWKCGAQNHVDFMWYAYD